jgi:hypothetical protein
MVFTQVLATEPISRTVQYYGYILLYVFFFILDQPDHLRLGAAIAMTSSLGVKYAKYARPVGATDPDCPGVAATPVDRF